MSALKCFFASSIIALSLASGPTAFAQASSNAPDPTSLEGKQAEGKARYERGVEAYAAGRFKDAIDLFLQADALAPSAALSFNIARAYEKISDDAASLQWYRDFRRRAPKAKNAAEVEQRIHALEASLASKGVQQLTVLSSPLGATVIIDEQPVGVTPFTGQLAPGRHKVVLSLRGYADSERKVELAAEHAQDLDVPLVPATRGTTAPDSAGPAAAGAGPIAPQPAAASDAPAGGPRFGVWPWVGLGAGAVGLGGALGFELARRSAESDAETDKTQVGYKEKLDRMQSHQTTARVLSAVGGALVITGGVLLVIDLTSRPKPSQQASLGCTDSGCGVQLRGRF